MEKFRICENEYHWYKIQRFCPPKNFLGIKIKGKWTDSCFYMGKRKPKIFRYKQDAEKTLKTLIDICERKNNSWKIL